MGMRYALLTCCALGLGTLAGCGASGAGGGGDAQVLLGGDGEGENVLTIDAPREAAYTLYLRDFTGPDHVAAADRTKEQTAAALGELGKGGRDLYVVSGERRSVLYHGFYTTFEPDLDAREAARAQSDRRAIERLVLTNAAGDKVKAFPRAVFQTLERPDPAAPPEWDLKNATGYWTVAIATYTDPALRKRAAVESVADARRRGVEAYYFHDDVQSFVCVGTWPREAIKEQRSSKTLNEDNVDPNNPRPLLVLGTQLPEAMKRRLQNRVDPRTRPNAPHARVARRDRGPVAHQGDGGLRLRRRRLLRQRGPPAAAHLHRHRHAARGDRERNPQHRPGWQGPRRAPHADLLSRTNACRNGVMLRP